MINIIYAQMPFRPNRGPKAFLLNAIKGLDILNYPYCINRNLDATSQLWIYNDPVALREAAKLKLKAVIGPSLYVFPRQIPPDIDLSNFVYLHPSNWTINFWKHFGFDRCPLESWTPGVNTSLFKERLKPEKGIVLVYFKQRDLEELSYIKTLLESFKIKYKVIIYGSYKLDEYLDNLRESKYIIWIGCTEAQSQAMAEAFSMNVPILVWDVSRFGHFNNLKIQKLYNKDELDYTNVTSAYYFDDNCGMKTKNQEDMKEYISQMEANWHNLNPLKYVVENLNPEKQGKKLIELFNKYYGISYSDGKSELLRSDKKWGQNIKYYFDFVKDRIGL